MAFVPACIDACARSWMTFLLGRGTRKKTLMGAGSACVVYVSLALHPILPSHNNHNHNHPPLPPRPLPVPQMRGTRHPPRDEEDGSHFASASIQARLTTVLIGSPASLSPCLEHYRKRQHVFTTFSLSNSNSNTFCYGIPCGMGSMDVYGMNAGVDVCRVYTSGDPT